MPNGLVSASERLRRLRRVEQLPGGWRLFGQD